MAKTEANKLNQITVQFLRKHGYFKGNNQGNIHWTSTHPDRQLSVNASFTPTETGGSLRLGYLANDSGDVTKKYFNYSINAVTTPCYFGGKRYWLICPTIKNGHYCSRRVGTVYYYDNYFGCRHCHNLTYESKNISRRADIRLFNLIFNQEKRVEKLKKSIRRWVYAGKLTRKAVKFEMLSSKLYPKYDLVRKVCI